MVIVCGYGASVATSPQSSGEIGQWYDRTRNCSSVDSVCDERVPSFYILNRMLETVLTNSNCDVMVR